METQQLDLSYLLSVCKLTLSKELLRAIILWKYSLYVNMFFLVSSNYYFNFVFQSVGQTKWSSTKIREQDVHMIGHILDDILMADPQVTTILMIISCPRWSIQILSMLPLIINSDACMYHAHACCHISFIN